MPTDMHNPAHPGQVLQEYLEGMNITRVAKHLHVSRVTLSKILNCRAGISAEMSLRLSAALGTHPSFWFVRNRHMDSRRPGARDSQPSSPSVKLHR